MDTPLEPPFLEKHVSRRTFAMLKNYHQWAILSRTFMLKEHAETLQALRAGAERFAAYPAEHKLFLETQIYLELFQRICTLIEDFFSLCNALWGDFKDFPKTIVNSPSPKNIAKKFTEDKWFILLRYADIESLGCNDSEKSFLENHRSRNISFLQNFVDLLNDFINEYWIV